MTISEILRIAEFTTMAGQRLRESVKETVISNGLMEMEISMTKILTRNMLQLLKNTSNNDTRY